MKVLTQLILLIPVIVASPPATSKIYRTDYEYNQKSNAFYKLHIDGSYLYKAKELCSLEGAKLLTLDNDNDLSQAHAMIKKYPDIENVWVGYDGKEHAQLNEKVVVFGDQNEPQESDIVYEYGHFYPESIAEPSEKCEVFNKLGEVKTLDCNHNYDSYPFICKVDANVAFYDESCEVYDTGYEYLAASGSCYKIPKVPVVWNEAYAECKAVGAHLVVVNSEAESQALSEFMRKTPAVVGSTSSPYFIAGFRTRGTTRDFFTIFNQTLQEAGFTQWIEHEPNNLHNDEYCGSLRWDGKLNDISCSDRYGFICEKEKQR